MKYQAVDLGADVAYSYRVAAARRNARVGEAHRRLKRVRSLPMARWQKCRLIRQGIWPQAFYGAETSVVPKSVFKRLRTQAGRAASVAKPGASPWLACSLGSWEPVDPEFCLLLQRLRLLVSSVVVTFARRSA